MKWIARIVFVFFVGMFIVRLMAQAPVAPASPPLTADEQAMLSLVVSLRTVANEACQGLDAFKQYSEATARVSTRIEANHPGFVFAWDKGVLVPKPAAPPPKR